MLRFQKTFFEIRTALKVQPIYNINDLRPYMLSKEYQFSFEVFSDYFMVS